MLTVSCPDNYVQRNLKAVVGIQDRTVSLACKMGYTNSANLLLAFKIELFQ